MIRLHFVVEGQTEEAFVNRVLGPHLATLGVICDARTVRTSHHPVRGGGGSYKHWQADIRLWLRQDRSAEAWVTTMLDLYALPRGFPAAILHAAADPKARLTALEQAWRTDLAQADQAGVEVQRFIPHLQRHEFEALLLVDPKKFDWEFMEHDAAIDALTQLAAAHDSPEDIDDGPATAPSKRVIEHIPEYAGRKVSAGPSIAEKIGIVSMKAKCPHFSQWLTRLEQLPHTT